jgi:hypothetical protein
MCSSPDVKTKADAVSETLFFLLFSVTDDGQIRDTGNSEQLFPKTKYSARFYSVHAVFSLR